MYGNNKCSSRMFDKVVILLWFWICSKEEMKKEKKEKQEEKEKREKLKTNIPKFVFPFFFFLLFELITDG